MPLISFRIWDLFPLRLGHLQRRQHLRDHQGNDHLDTQLTEVLHRCDISARPNKHSLECVPERTVSLLVIWIAPACSEL